ncbi:nucleoside-diphosphate-sugar pyrophosphorylase [Desulfosarcina widdelii]|uniref:Nucleoside-diphosphate-sugar pyrophosphorylase n=1 Tax=Desulfosarcina widdelii TaxID=947919 RepID=A0A5K7ZD46_9BACT|nr:sugar phosphate nucleotidyltransferase [Desulfosarcina widdelii]BBO77651.1 nucleoside-diphosphate-sugar pyrophosphorylase [Desulfosarcina widdelii]
MEAIILAGGLGTRLKPYTTVIPKPIVPVGEKAIMEIVLNQLVSYGFTRVTLAVNHLAQLIMAYFGNGERYGLQIEYSFEDKPLGTIGPLKLIETLPDNFLVMNGDILTDFDFERFFQKHIENRAMATIATYERDVKIDFGVLRYDATTKKIDSFTEKPTHHYSVSMGIYAFSKRILQYVPDNQAYGFDQLMLDMIGNHENIQAYPFDGYWLDIGRPDDYEKAGREYPAMKDKFEGRKQ